MSQRLLLAIADRDVASSAAALAQEGEGLEVVAVVDEPEEVTRALRRHDVDVVVLHDTLGATPVLDLARELGQAFPETGLVLIAEDDSPELLRAAMQAGLRDVVSLPLSLEQLESSVRAAAQWSRTLRERVTGEESAAGGLGGRLIAVAGAKGGVGTTTVALQLALAAIRAMPGRPGLRRRLRPPEGRPARVPRPPAPAQRGRPGRGRVGDLGPPPAGDALHARRGLPRAARARGGRARGGDRLRRRPLGAQRGPRAPRAHRRRPRRRGLRGGRDRRRDRQRRRRRDDPRRGLAARRAAAARALAPAPGPRRRRRPRRPQPHLAQARDPARPRPQGRRRAAGEDDPARRLLRVRDRGQHRRADPRGGRQAARRLRRAGGGARRAPERRGGRARRAARAAGCWRGSAASAARRAPSSWACCRS